MPKTKVGSWGVDDNIRAELAKDIQAAGGIDLFDKGKFHALEQILSNPSKRQIYGNNKHLRKQIRNLVLNQWKKWPKEKYLDQVYIPFVLGVRQFKPNPSTKVSTDFDCEENDKAEAEEDDRAPTQPRYCNKPDSKTTQSPRAQQKPQQKPHYSKMRNKIGKLVSVHLDDGLIFSTLWVDRRLDEAVLKVYVAEDGMTVKLAKKNPKIDNALGLLGDQYDWAKDRTNFVVKALNTELKRLGKEDPKGDDWSKEDVIFLEEEVSRTFVDIHGKTTGEAAFQIDDDGLQSISFFLKKIGYEEAPAAAKFKRNSNSATGFGANTSNSNSFSEETVEDDTVREEMNYMAQGIADLMNMMKTMQEQQAAAQAHAQAQAQATAQQAAYAQQQAAQTQQQLEEALRQARGATGAQAQANRDAELKGQFEQAYLKKHGTPAPDIAFSEYMMGQNSHGLD